MKVFRDLIEVFKMFYGYTEIDIKVLFTLNGNDKQGRRSHRSWGAMTPPPLLFEAKGDGGHNLGIIHISHTGTRMGFFMG